MAAVSGSTVLRELDSGLSALRGDLRSMDSAVTDSGMRMQELGEAKLALYKRLARHRLAQLERGDVIRGLDTVSHYIHDLLGRRESEHRSLLGLFFWWLAAHCKHRHRNRNRGTQNGDDK